MPTVIAIAKKDTSNNNPSTSTGANPSTAATGSNPSSVAPKEKGGKNSKENKAAEEGMIQ